MNQPWIYMYSPSRSPLPPPTPPIILNIPSIITSSCNKYKSYSWDFLHYSSLGFNKSSKSDILYWIAHLSSNQPHLSLQWPSVSSEHLSSCHCYSVTQLCLSLPDPMDFSTLLFPVLHHLQELAQTHVHWVSDAIQQSHPLSPISPAFNLSQHQGLFFTE